MGHLRSRAHALLLLAASFAAAACGSVGPTVRPLATPSPVQSLSPTIEASPAPTAGWAEPAAYTFTLESQCGERALIGTFRVTVRNHATVAFKGLDEAAKRFQGSPETIPTIAGVLREAEAAKVGNASSVEVETDPVDGHPVDVAIDWIANAIDDEACYRISDYVPDASAG